MKRSITVLSRDVKSHIRIVPVFGMFFTDSIKLLSVRHHMRSFHNISAQQQNRVSPAPNYSATSNAHIAFVPTNQGYYAQKEEIKTAADISANPNSSGGSIGSLATFNTTTSRLHGSEDGFVQSGQNNGTNYRPGSRLTPSEENILNRNLTNVLPAPHRSSTPSSANQTRARMQDGKFKCEYCPKAYKANANLQKHINEHHPRQAGQGMFELLVETALYFQTRVASNDLFYPRMSYALTLLEAISHLEEEQRSLLNNLKCPVFRNKTRPICFLPSPMSSMEECLGLRLVLGE